MEKKWFQDDVSGLIYKKEQGGEVNLNDRDPEGDTPLIAAVRWKDMGLIKRLLNLGVDVNVKNEKFNNYTALHYAIEGGNLEIVKLLVKNGADIQVKIKEEEDSDSLTALELAYLRNSDDNSNMSEIVSYLEGEYGRREINEDGIEIANGEIYEEDDAIVVSADGDEKDNKKEAILNKTKHKKFRASEVSHKGVYISEEELEEFIEKTIEAINQKVREVEALPSDQPMSEEQKRDLAMLEEALYRSAKAYGMVDFLRDKKLDGIEDVDIRKRLRHNIIVTWRYAVSRLAVKPIKAAYFKIKSGAKWIKDKLAKVDWRKLSIWMAVAITSPIWATPLIIAGCGIAVTAVALLPVGFTLWEAYKGLKWLGEKTLGGLRTISDAIRGKFNTLKDQTKNALGNIYVVKSGGMAQAVERYGQKHSSKGFDVDSNKYEKDENFEKLLVTGTLKELLKERDKIFKEISLSNKNNDKIKFNLVTQKLKERVKQGQDISQYEGLTFKQVVNLREILEEENDKLTEAMANSIKAKGSKSININDFKFFVDKLSKGELSDLCKMLQGEDYNNMDGTSLKMIVGLLAKQMENETDVEKRQKLENDIISLSEVAKKKHIPVELIQMYVPDTVKVSEILKQKQKEAEKEEQAKLEENVEKGSEEEIEEEGIEEDQEEIEIEGIAKKVISEINPEPKKEPAPEPEPEQTEREVKYHKESLAQDEAHDVTVIKRSVEPASPRYASTNPPTLLNLVSENKSANEGIRKLAESYLAGEKVEEKAVEKTGPAKVPTEPAKLEEKAEQKVAVVTPTPKGMEENIAKFNPANKQIIESANGKLNGNIPPAPPQPPADWTPKQANNASNNVSNNVSKDSNNVKTQNKAKLEGGVGFGNGIFGEGGLSSIKLKSTKSKTEDKEQKKEDKVSEAQEKFNELNELRAKRLKRIEGESEQRKTLEPQLQNNDKVQRNEKDMEF